MLANELKTFAGREEEAPQTIFPCSLACKKVMKKCVTAIYDRVFSFCTLCNFLYSRVIAKTSKYDQDTCNYKAKN